VFERFSESGRQIVVFGQEEARALSHNYIGTEHILLGLLREPDEVTGRVFGRFGVTLEGARAQVDRILGRGDEVTSGQIPFTPRAKRSLELALRHALEAGSKHIEPQHLFLGLLDDEDGVAAQILSDFAPLEDFRGALGGTKLAPRKLVARAGSVRRGALRVLVVGWLLFAVAMGIGILIGWAIWG
jgi:ATP-dependent Clp protease ATP-binding subunit ClpA